MIPPTRTVPSRQRGATTALTLAIPLVYLAVFASVLPRKGDADWDQMLAFHRIALWNTHWNGLEKHWNPLMRGGMSLAGDPQMPVLSPQMLLSRIFPIAVALKLAALLFLAAGALGAWLLARQMRFDRRTAALAAALFAGNGYIVSRLSHGHLDFLGTLCLPLWLWGNRAVLSPPTGSLGRSRRFLLFVAGGGLVFALSTDGAPINFILTIVWAGFEAAWLAWRRRRPEPVVFFAAAVGVGVLLDAVHVLPMVANQFDFPRLRPAIFVDPLLFLWFLLVAARGRVLPAPANGHELSVYIGVFLAYLLFRYRREIRAGIPAEDRKALLAGSVLAFLIGTGSWRALGRFAPPGPFDLLHALPGFRAIGIPARFWGFLALPLALAGSLAIRAFDRETSTTGRRLFQLGLFLSIVVFQAASVAGPFLSAKGRLISPEPAVPDRIVSIDRVFLKPEETQAQVLRPDRCVLNSYNMHDYFQGIESAGTELVQSARASGREVSVPARWDGWSRIVIETPPHSAPLTIIFNQNFHPLWRATRGVVVRDRRGNLVLRLSGIERSESLVLEFHDPWSSLGRRVTLATFAVVVPIALLLAWKLPSEALRKGARGRRGLEA